MNPSTIVQTSPVIQHSFSAGINTSLPPELLKDNECVDILNLEYNEDDHLVTRAGVQRFFPEKFEHRITSLHYYENDDGDIWILNTEGTKLYASANFNPVPSDITNGLVFPDNTFWQWRNYAGLAIGVNKGTTGDNPIKVSGPTPDVAPLGGDAPKGKYIEIWNERVWIASAEFPNTLYASKLGDPENWTDSGVDGAIQIDIGKNDGDRITGLCVFNKQLFVFKRKKIYVIGAVEGTNPYESTNLFADVYASSVGCVSPYSIKPVLNDVLFLADGGICSLVSAPLGELKTIVLSRNVKELSKIRKVSSEISAYVSEESNQYWLMVPDTASTRNIHETYVLDYHNIENGVVRWFRFDGKIAGTCAETIYVNGDRLTIIASQDKGVYFYRHQVYNFSGVWDFALWDISLFDRSTEIVFNDDDVSYTKRLETKAFNFGLPVIRKLFQSFGFNTTLLSNDLKIQVNYHFDKNTSFGDQFIFNYIFNDTGAVWDVSSWDTARWDKRLKLDFTTIRDFKRNDFGRKAQNVTVVFSNDLNQGFILRELMLEIAPLNTNQANDINRIM